MEKLEALRVFGVFVYLSSGVMDYSFRAAVGMSARADVSRYPSTQRAGGPLKGARGSR